MLSLKFNGEKSGGTSRHRLYVISDVHGHAEELDKILKDIEEDIARHPLAQIEIVLAGDMINRGPHSKSVMDRIVRLKAEATSRCKVTVLWGNHEYALKKFFAVMKDEKDFEHNLSFIQEGGATTLASYNVFLPKGNPSQYHWDWITHDDIKNAQQKLRHQFPVSHKMVLHDLKIDHRYKPEGQQKGYYICHGGVTTATAIDEQSRAVLIGVDYKENFSREFTKYSGDALRDKNGDEWVVIHGHTIIGRYPHTAKGRISIDTGCFTGGRLSCVVIADGEVEKILQCPSLYAPYDEKLIPSNSNWPPHKKQMSLLDKMMMMTGWK